jgi:microcystin-dependent protein
MGQPYVGEIRIFAGNFAPYGWLFCDGSLLSIAENETLFNLIGTTYGGDGQETFGLPDLRGRIPVHQGQGPGLGQYAMGQMGGTETETLTTQQIPAHQHAVMAATGVGNQTPPTGSVVAQSPQIQLYIEDAPDANMAAGAVGSTGGSRAHENLMPYLCVNYIISLYGIFPSPN